MKKINLFDKTISPLSDGKGCPVERGGVWELPRRRSAPPLLGKKGNTKCRHTGERRYPVVSTGAGGSRFSAG